MSKQPEALRLAELLDQDRPAHAHEAAAELRRLHDLLGKANALNRIRGERIAALEQAGRQALEALCDVDELETADNGVIAVLVEITALRQALGDKQ